MAANRLELEHHGGDVLRWRQFSGIPLADIIILTKLALQVAAGEENGAGSALAAQRVLLTEVRPVAAHPGNGTGTADAQLTGVAVNAAFPGAGVTMGQAFFGLANALYKLAG